MLDKIRVVRWGIVCVSLTTEPGCPSLSRWSLISDDWLHEIKYDGFRTQLIRDWAGVRAFSRNGYDWSPRYWPSVTTAEKLPAESFIIDGEMICAGSRRAAELP
ncbi:MAG: hypothetical protein E5Y52_11405 [Mesorhizobium sp.]|nr:MAG: hypothetical protein E5Y52_11405 [Mesorhizobium sp.]